ncbi:uncharacterized protein PHACADRAFT_246052 [Phanerochaete carnosa HHB-10118-sp]|uniref:Uncharacterized protein n=1 Tax=Phanerochaete carnosa (strain HHB-10118-sp) TaxID=650164 RepID=K5WL94_PHACS|nr:uncharacterized protein PHACADRAFT_246052 [Phanerochaete carnosa HHB-10118-sp]EKM60200.1 hypothetical protein PHACADRAFT_246052 [Phanerochaete carnosa HHB-10118-sp]
MLKVPRSQTVPTATKSSERSMSLVAARRPADNPLSAYCAEPLRKERAEVAAAKVRNKKDQDQRLLSTSTVVYASLYALYPVNLHLSVLITVDANPVFKPKPSKKSFAPARYELDFAAKMALPQGAPWGRS